MTQFLLCTQKAEAVILFISGVGAFKSGGGQSHSVVKVLREFLCPRGKRENPENRLKELMGTAIETSVMWLQDKN